jgi:hypothetical protein
VRLDACAKTRRMSEPNHALSRKVFIAACACGAAAAGSGLARAAGGTFSTVSQLRAHRAAIYSLHVYELRPAVQTGRAVTPLALEHFPGVHLTIHHDAATIDATLQALVTSAPQTSAAPFDARWGLVYFGHGGVRLFSAYTDVLATQGSLGARRVVFNNPSPLLGALHDAAS